MRRRLGKRRELGEEEVEREERLDEEKVEKKERNW
jgi:hypothetical protein